MARAMATPSVVDVPRPGSSKITSELHHQLPPERLESVAVLLELWILQLC